MQICLYSSVFFPSIGGIEQVSYTLANHWTQQGHHVIVVTDTPATNVQDTTFSFSVIRSPTLATWNSLLSTTDLIVSNGYSLRHLASWLSSYQPIIWIHQTYIPALIQQKQNSWKTLARSFIGRAMLLLNSTHVYISHAIQIQVGSSKGVVIYNPVDNCFRPLSNVKNINHFAFFGRMVSSKGVDTLLEALALCKQKDRIYQLDLYGEGSSLYEFQELAKTLGVDFQLRWHPFVRGEALVRAMNAAGAVVMPSQWAEPMGVVAVEAMACGKVVIGSRKGGLGEVLEGWGITFENGNANQLADCMVQLIEQPGLKQALEKKAYERSRDFSIDTVGSKYLQLFERILKK